MTFKVEGPGHKERLYCLHFNEGDTQKLGRDSGKSSEECYFVKKVGVYCPPCLIWNKRMDVFPVI